MQCRAGQGVPQGSNRRPAPSAAAAQLLALTPASTMHPHLVGSLQRVAGGYHKEVQQARRLKLGIQLNLHRKERSGRQSGRGGGG